MKIKTELKAIFFSSAVISWTAMWVHVSEVFLGLSNEPNVCDGCLIGLG